MADISLRNTPLHLHISSLCEWSQHTFWPLTTLWSCDATVLIEWMDPASAARPTLESANIQGNPGLEDWPTMLASLRWPIKSNHHRTTSEDRYSAPVPPARRHSLSLSLCLLTTRLPYGHLLWLPLNYPSKNISLRFTEGQKEWRGRKRMEGKTQAWKKQKRSERQEREMGKSVREIDWARTSRESA